jgi:polyphosphate kinase
MSGRSSKLSYPEYEQLAKPLLKELARMSRWVAETGQRIVVVFEGRDTAGKGGSIDMIARVLNPRQCRVAALAVADGARAAAMVFPALHSLSAGSRRAHPVRPQLVQPRRRRAGDGLLHAGAEGCLPESCSRVRAASRRRRDPAVQILAVLRPGAAGGKVREPARNPLKRWKLSPIDVHARERYDAYTEARERMLAETHTDFAPWTLVDFNDQSHGRLTLLRDFLDRVPTPTCRSRSSTGRRFRTSRLKERYGVLRPIEPYAIESAPRDAEGGII